MSTPSLTYGFYRDTYHGTMDESDFTAALVKARAVLVSMTGEEIPEQHAEKWKLALSALCERVSGKDTQGTLKSETVGSVSFTYADRIAEIDDLSVVYPFLVGTGLLWRGVR